MPKAFGTGTRLRIGVIGACGGAGASSFAATLARVRSRSRPVALIDLDAAGGGLDVLLGIEESPGLRWPDLSSARGEVPGQDLLDLMPRWGEVAVLSGDRMRPASAPDEIRALVLGALAGVSDLVLDLNRMENPIQACDRVLVVVPRDLRAVAGAQVTLAKLEEAGFARTQLGLVVRGPAPGGLDPFQVEQVLGVRLAVQLRADRGLAQAIERGAGPQGRGLLGAARCASTFLDGAEPMASEFESRSGSTRRAVLGRTA